MKNIGILVLLVIFASCTEEQPPKEYAVVHGTITNPKEGLNLRLYNPISSENTIIEVDDKGNFRDTLKLKEPQTFTVDYGEIFNLHLQNDMDVAVSFDGKDVRTSIIFQGKGKEENEFIKSKERQTLELFGEDYREYLSLEQAEFDAKTNAFVSGINAELDAKESVFDTTFINSEKRKIEAFKKDIVAQHVKQLQMNEELATGNPSPDFTDYINYKGGTTSLKDLKGSYVYFDIWATWCVPCIYEIPFLKEVEKKFEGKNIQFVSISIDRAADEKKWRKMIVEKELDGMQLLADKEINSEFIKGYHIQGIPRFILLDPDGNIVNYDAPRPSQPELTELITSLSI